MVFGIGVALNCTPRSHGLHLDSVKIWAQSGYLQVSGLDQMAKYLLNLVQCLHPIIEK